jgi:arylsulfatase A-like enzyme
MRYLLPALSLALSLPAHAAAPIRLIDELGSARITSPVTAVAATDTLAAAESQVVLDETFEQFSPSAAGWPRGSCRAVRRPEDPGRAGVYEGRNPHRCLFLVPADPSAHYRVSREIRSAHPGIDFRVIESRQTLSHPARRNHPQDLAAALHGRFVGMSNLLDIHQLPAAEPDRTWQAHELQLFTSSQTRSLVIILNDAEGTLTARNVRVHFDNLRVERLLPTRQQELALLKGYAALASLGGEQGVAKHGQLLPVHDQEHAEPPYDRNHDFREALFAPAPTDLTFDIEVPKAARLRFSCALLKMSQPGDSVTFQILVASGDRGPRVVFSRVVRIGEGGKGWHWVDDEVDLSELAGRKVQLTLQTRAPAGTAGYALWGAPVIESPRATGEPPNVLIVAVDTLRADRLSAYGYGRPTSPNIDRLAADGVLFENAISPSNWTSPAFASMFTGQMPSSHGVIHRARAIPDEVVTLPEHFRMGGWSTHAVAYKAYLYNMGFEQGFDVWFNVPKHNPVADENLEKVLEVIETRGRSRFFLFVHFNDPHQPFNQPRPFDRAFNHPRTLKRFGLRLPFVVSTDGNVAGCRGCKKSGGPDSVFRTVTSDLYDGEIAYLDNALGRLFDALRQRDLYDDTLIVFVADHGEVIWDRPGFFGHGGPNLYDELIRVPLIIKPPASAHAARDKRVAAQVQTHDLLPTLLDLAGLPPPGVTPDGASLMPHLATQAPAVTAERNAISENIKHDIVAVRTQRFKYVLHHPPGRFRERLFHLVSDPGERTNVANRYPDEVAELRLVALDHLVRSRRGRYLLVTGDGVRRNYRVRVRADAAVRGVRALHGLTLRRSHNDSEFTFEGTSSSTGIVLLARFDADAEVGFDVDVGTRGRGALKVHRQLAPDSFSRPVAPLAEMAARGEVSLLAVDGP